ncbi:MAG: glycosyltransferase family 2 protein [Oligoflexia bacterium]
MSPKVSIVTPTFNSARTVLDTVRSILSQSYTDWEHIVVDNCSTDNTLDLVRDKYKKANQLPRLKVICERDKGISDAFNKGILASSGDVIHILNSDDQYAATDSLARVMSAFENPAIDLVHGSIIFDDPVYGSQVRGPLNCPVTDAMPFQHPATFVRKRVYDRVGLFDLSYRYAMDYEWVVRLFDQHSLVSQINIRGGPLAHMGGSGASAKHERATLQESRRALTKNGLWSWRARAYLELRKLRLRLKDLLPGRLGIWTIKVWRLIKWKNNES